MHLSHARAIANLAEPWELWRRGAAISDTRKRQRHGHSRSRTIATTSQSNSMRMAARCCLTLGFSKPLPIALM
jgi:hypothetical protein